MTIESRLAEIRALVEKLDGGLPCAWCDIPAVGLARHNDGLLNPSCGEDGHGFDWRAAGDPRTIAGALTSYPTMATAIMDALDVENEPMPSGSEGDDWYHAGWQDAMFNVKSRITAALGVQG